jgi:hypothetical protein
VLLEKGKLGIDQSSKGVDQSAAIKQMVEEVISIGANNQEEIHQL